MSPVTASVLFLILLILTLFGVIHERLDRHEGRASESLVTSDMKRYDTHHQTLFVLVHGFLGDSKKTQKKWTTVKEALRPYGDVLLLRYPAWILSNAEPDHVASAVRHAIQNHAKPYTRIVLVGHSIGALIVRRAFLDEVKNFTTNSWAKAVTRIVLLAGMNRGWDVSGQKPMDMYWYRHVSYWLGSWFGRLTASGNLIRSTETGAPFIQNLRLDWLHHVQTSAEDRIPEAVQLLGDIDDIVSEEDNKDLRVAVAPKFARLRVRGTGHANILDLADKTHFGTPSTLGKYREGKLLLAATRPWADIVRENEELPYDIDRDVTHIVFVLHGIRDLGQWAANFEEELQRKFRRHPSSTGNAKLAVVSVRYGFFGMGQFLLYANREKYVRWFMDQYTETLARYPNVKRIDFVGHSNGTYLLARALQKYSAMKIDHIVFAGSVVPKNYQWNTLFQDGRVKSVRNYVASDDWVVALFPRFFESWGMRFFDNEIGSAGFNGFSWEGMDPRSQVGEDKLAHNVEFISGTHSAFLKHVGAIADYLVSGGQKPLPNENNTRGPWCWLKWLSDWAVGVVWFGLAVGVVWLGARVTGAAGHPGWPLLLLYLTAVVFVLRWV